MVRVELADVNVLIALFDPEHIHHESAQNWFATANQSGWATCLLTENGFLRIVTKPNYPTIQWNTAEAITRLASLIHTHAHSHHFFSDNLSLCDSSLFRREAIQGPQQLTDLALLGLCQRHNATLITFDSGTRETARAVVAGRSDLVRLLSP